MFTVNLYRPNPLTYPKAFLVTVHKKLKYDQTFKHLVACQLFFDVLF